MADQPRFLTLADVAEVLNISASQTYALVRSGELEAIKVGGRGQWRVEQSKLEDYITRMYRQTKEFLADHPFVEPPAGVDTDAVIEAGPGPGDAVRADRA